MTSTAIKDTSGKVANVAETLKGLGVSLKHVNYHLSFAGTAREPHPWCWTDPSGSFRDMLSKQAELADLLAGCIDRWVKANPQENQANLDAMKQAAKYYKGISKSLRTNAKNARFAQSNLEVTNT